MRPSGKLLAWIESEGNGEAVAAFIGDGVASGAAKRRAPARRAHPSPEQARAWVEAEAAALGLPVAWLEEPPTL